MLKSPRRKRPSLRQQLTAALYQLGLDPQTAELHHSPPMALRVCRTLPGGSIEYQPDENDPKHMVWMSREDHKRQTYGVPATTAGSDIHMIAKVKRMVRKEQAALRPSKAARLKRKWPKRKLRP